jgi:hypothetical protein
LLRRNATICGLVPYTPCAATAAQGDHEEEITMAKTNVHTASREDLVAAGVRAELADEILKLRRKGRVELAALEELPGVGPATLEQLRKALDFRDQSGNGDDREQGHGGEPTREAAGAARDATRAGTEAASAATGATGQLVRDTATAATEIAAEAPHDGLQVARRTTDAVAGAQRELTHRTAEGTAELGQELSDLLQEQVRYQLATVAALGEAVDWNRLFRLQADYLRDSLERTAQLTRRWLDLSQAVLTANLNAAGDRRNRAA